MADKKCGVNFTKEGGRTNLKQIDYTGTFEEFKEKLKKRFADLKDLKEDEDLVLESTVANIEVPLIDSQQTFEIFVKNVDGFDKEAKKKEILVIKIKHKNKEEHKEEHKEQETQPPIPEEKKEPSPKPVRPKPIPPLNIANLNQQQQNNQNKPNHNKPLVSARDRADNTLVDKMNAFFQNEYEKFKEKLFDELTDKKLKEKQTKFEKEKNGVGEIVHPNIVCNNCCDEMKDEEINDLDQKISCIKGSRFHCAECKNYNLCSKCAKLGKHSKDHFFVKYNKPVPKGYEKGYDSMVKKNKQTENVSKNGDFKAKIELINTGKEAWKNCYLMPIGFGDGFITDGKKIKCDKTFQPGQSHIFNLNLKCICPGEFVSKLKMFNEQGVPFGEVVYNFIKVN